MLKSIDIVKVRCFHAVRYNSPTKLPLRITCVMFTGRILTPSASKEQDKLSFTTPDRDIVALVWHFRKTKYC